MKVSRTIAYGIHATVLLARAPPGLPVPCSQLASEGRMPERFLLQILRCLVTHGLLESVCGVAGGYSLSRSPEKITLRDIIEAFDNPLEVRLPLLEILSPHVYSKVVSILQSVAEAARAELQKMTVADLAAYDGRQVDLASADKISSATAAAAILGPIDYDAQSGESATIH